MSAEDFYATQIKTTKGIFGTYKAIKTYNAISEEDKETRLAYARAIETVNGKLGEQMVNLNGAKATAGTYAKSLINVTAKTLAINAATAALNTGLNLVVSLGVQLLISGISKLAHEYENYQEKLNESIDEAYEAATAYREEQDSIDSLLDRYAEITTNYSDLSDAREELISIQDELIEKYGKEVAGIDLVNKSYGENIELIKQAQKAAAEEYVTENKSKYDNAKKFLDEKSVVETVVDDSGWTSLNTKGNYSKIASPGIGDWASDSNVKDIIDKYDNALITKAVSVGKMYDDLYVSGTAEEQLETLRGLYGELSELWEDMDVDSNEKDWLDGISDRIETLNKNITESTEVVEEWERQLKISESADSKTLGEGLDKANKLKDDLINAKTSSEKFEASSALSDLREKLYARTEDENDNVIDQEGRNILDAFFASIDSVIDENNKTLYEKTNVYKETLSKFQNETYDEISRGGEKISSAMQTLMSGGSLSSDDVVELINLDSSLAGQIRQTADGYTISFNALSEARKSYLQETKDNIKEEIKSNNDYIAELEVQRRAILNTGTGRYSEELPKVEENIASAESAIAVWEQYLNLIENADSEMDTILSDINNVFSEIDMIKNSLSTLANGESLDTSFFKDYPELYEYAGDTEKLRAELEKMAKLKTAPIIAQLTHLITASDSEEEISKYQAMIKMLQDASGTAKEFEIQSNIAEIEATIEANDTIIEKLEKEKELQNDILDTLNAQKEQLENIISNYETAADTVTEAIDEEISALEDQKSAIEDKYNAEIEALQSENEERDLNITLREKELALEKAKNTKVRIYSASRGWTIQTDSEAVKSAQKEYDDALTDVKINDLENQRDAETAEFDEKIKEYEEYKSAWQDVVDSYTKAQNELTTASVLGSNWREMIYSKDTGIINTFAENYAYFQDKLHNQIEPQIADVQNTISAYDDQISAQNTLKDKQQEYLDFYTEYSEKFSELTDSQIEALERLKDAITGGDDAAAVLSMAQIQATSDAVTSAVGSYRNGGIVDYTGLAEVHGSKISPEVILNAAQAGKMWKWLQTSDTMVDGVLQADKVMEKFTRFMNSAPASLAEVQTRYTPRFDGTPKFGDFGEPKNIENRNYANTNNSYTWAITGNNMEIDSYDKFKGYMDRYVREAQMNLAVGKR